VSYCSHENEQITLNHLDGLEEIAPKSAELQKGVRAARTQFTNVIYGPLAIIVAALLKVQSHRLHYYQGGATKALAGYSSSFALKPDRIKSSLSAFSLILTCKSQKGEYF
jgi:hypothetical protein